MKKLSILIALITVLVNVVVAQKNNKFTFHKEETVDGFLFKGQTFKQEGQLVAFEKGNTIVDYEIYYYLKKNPEYKNVTLTKIMVTTPILADKKDKKFYVANRQTFHFEEESLKDLTISPIDNKEGYYEIKIDINNSKKIPFVDVSVNNPEMIIWGLGDKDRPVGIRSVEVGKFKSAADFEKLKKLLQVK